MSLFQIAFSSLGIPAVPSILLDFHTGSKFHMEILCFWRNYQCQWASLESVPCQSKSFLIVRQETSSQTSMYFCTEILNAKLSLLIFDEMFTSFQSISQW